MWPIPDTSGDRAVCEATTAVLQVVALSPQSHYSLLALCGRKGKRCARLPSPILQRATTNKRAAHPPALTYQQPPRHITSPGTTTVVCSDAPPLPLQWPQRPIERWRQSIQFSPALSQPPSRSRNTARRVRTKPSHPGTQVFGAYSYVPLRVAV